MHTHMHTDRKSEGVCVRVYGCVCVCLSVWMRQLSVLLISKMSITFQAGKKCVCVRFVYVCARVVVNVCVCVRFVYVCVRVFVNVCVWACWPTKLLSE